MKPIICMVGLLALSACGATTGDDISSRSDYSPIRGSFFVPIDGQTRAALDTSPEWEDLVGRYN